MDPLHAWAAYARVQAELASRQVIDSQSWGMETGLGRLLATLGEFSPDRELDRTVRSESRRERHRSRLRRVRLAAASVERGPERRLDACRQLQAVRAMVSEEDWSLLVAIGEGREYAEIAAVLGGTPGRLRVRVLRLRRELPSGHTAQPSRRAA